MSVRDALRSAPMVAHVAGLRLPRVGEGWDIVRTPADIGFLALAHLRTTGAAVGPVLYDGPNERVYYAVGTGTAETWANLPVRHLSTHAWLVALGLELIDDWFGGWGRQAAPSSSPRDRPPPPGRSLISVRLSSCGEPRAWSAAGRAGRRTDRSRSDRPQRRE
ncbi:hypothetical protein ACFYZB_22945 [Streptomyces sp. NPDC001852]|uniref:hypothetical protein n=1 Tax=Streptomyces sp. NPDC001852 TaxID=3364619 RepID=UPI0036A7E87D